MALSTAQASGIHVVGPVAASPEPASLGVDISKEITAGGVLVNASTGAAVGGLRVRAFYDSPAERTSTEGRSSPEAKIGEGVSDSSGRFVIAFDGNQIAREKLAALLCLEQRALVLSVLGADGNALLTAPPAAVHAGGYETTLRVPVSNKPVSAEEWSVLGKRLQTARVARLDVLVEQLAQPDSPLFGDIAIETRQTMIAALERAFLDPTGVLQGTGVPLPSLHSLQDPAAASAYADALGGRFEEADVRQAFDDLVGKAASFAALDEVDWLFAPEQIARGQLGSAVNAFIEGYRAGSVDRPRLTQDALLIGYRDYLRAIWTQTASAAPWQGHQLTLTQSLAQLDARFHQDFSIGDLSERPANQIGRRDPARRPDVPGRKRASDLRRRSGEHRGPRYAEYASISRLPDRPDQRLCRRTAPALSHRFRPDRFGGLEPGPGEHRCPAGILPRRIPERSGTLPC